MSETDIDWAESWVCRSKHDYNVVWERTIDWMNPENMPLDWVDWRTIGTDSR